MGIIGGKILILFLLIAVGLGVMISGGWVTWKPDGYSCLSGRKWIAQVDKQRAFAVGKLNFYYQPYSFTCDSDHQYDPNIYQSLGGGRLELKQ